MARVACHGQFRVHSLWFSHLSLEGFLFLVEPVALLLQLADSGISTAGVGEGSFWWVVSRRRGLGPCGCQLLQQVCPLFGQLPDLDTQFRSFVGALGSLVL